MTRRPLHIAPRALAALAFAIVLAACSVNVPATPGTAAGDGKVNKATDKKPASSPTAPGGSPAPIASTGAQAEATPEVLPSLGLLLAGQVKIDTSAMLQLGIAERTPVGVKLISNNGPGLISDKGVGLISNNSGALVSNNSGALISNNSGAIVSKTKYALRQAAGARTLLPVQGMLVKAVSLRTGEILAGPSATDAEGNYRLGFIAAPETNLQIVAYVNNKEAEAAFNYAAFSAPVAAQIVNTDTTDLVCTYMIKVLGGRVQNGINARMRGENVTLDEDKFTNADERKQAEDINAILQKITPEMAKTLDQNGETSRKFAERTVAYADLSKPVFKELFQIFEEIRAFDASLATAPSPSVQDEVATLLSAVSTIPEIPGALQRHGMPKAQAESIAERMSNTSADLNSELARVGNDQSSEVLGPLLQIPGLTEFLPLFESPQP